MAAGTTMNQRDCRTRQYRALLPRKSRSPASRHPQAMVSTTVPAVFPIAKLASGCRYQTKICFMS